MGPTKLSDAAKTRRLHVKAMWSVPVVVAILATIGLLSKSVAAATDHTASFVQKSASEAINILSNISLADLDRREKFRSVILKHFDAPSIGRNVVEPYWSKASPEQQARFQLTFESALADIYTDRFFDYDGQSLQIKETVADAGGVTVVKTTVSTPTGSKTYDVDWVVAGPAGKEQFLDVVIDGISTSVTTKQDYASVLRSKNGDLDALTAALEAKRH